MWKGTCSSAWTFLSLLIVIHSNSYIILTIPNDVESGEKLNRVRTLKGDSQEVG